MKRPIPITLFPTIPAIDLVVFDYLSPASLVQFYWFLSVRSSAYVSAFSLRSTPAPIPDDHTRLVERIGIDGRLGGTTARVPVDVELVLAVVLDVMAASIVVAACR